MRNIGQIKKIVRETLFQDFDHIRIIEIKVHEDLGWDNEDVLRIDVVFEGAPKDLDALKLSGAIRHLRPKLDAIDESALPLLSFISKADLERRKRVSP